MFEQFTDVIPSFFGYLNQGHLTLTIFLHTIITIIVIPMFFIYFQEKKGLKEKIEIKLI